MSPGNCLAILHRGPTAGQCSIRDAGCLASATGRSPPSRDCFSDWHGSMHTSARFGCLEGLGGLHRVSFGWQKARMDQALTYAANEILASCRETRSHQKNGRVALGVPLLWGRAAGRKDWVLA